MIKYLILWFSKKFF